MLRLLTHSALLALALVAPTAGAVSGQIPGGLEDRESERTRQCVLEAVDPPDPGVSQELTERGGGLATLLESSRFPGVLRGSESLPPEMVALQQKVERYNRDYADLMTDCRDADRAGVDCAESRDMEALREEIRAQAQELLRSLGSGSAGGGAGAWNAWAMNCADRVLLREVVREVCPAGSTVICNATGEQVEAHGTTLNFASSLSDLWNWRSETPWSAFEPLSGLPGALKGGGTETRVQVGNIVASVRLGLDLVDVEGDPGRAAAARTFGAAFDMNFESNGWTVLPVIEFSLKQDAPILGETVYAFFVETERGPATVLNAEADPALPFAWSTPLGPDVAEWLQSGQPLWFTAGGPLPGGGMGPRFTFPFPAEGLQDAILDMAIYLGDSVMTDLGRIAAGG